MNNSKIGLELIKINNDKLPLKGLKDKIDQMKYIKSQQKIRMVTSNSGLTIGIICLILIVILFIVIYLFIRTARNNKNNRNNEDDTSNIGGTSNTMAESLLAEYRIRRQARQLRRAERQLDSEENVPLEDGSNTDTVERYDRRLHSSPNSPVPLPRERSHTLVSTLSIPRVSIMTPDSCRYEARPDSL